MAENANVEDGDKSRLRKALKQLRNDREEETAARELLEEQPSESERSLCRELEEFMYSWEREIERPNNLSTKIWQIMQSNNTKSDTLKSDLT